MNLPVPTAVTEGIRAVDAGTTGGDLVDAVSLIAWGDVLQRSYLVRGQVFGTIIKHTRCRYLSVPQVVASLDAQAKLPRARSMVSAGTIAPPDSSAASVSLRVDGLLPASGFTPSKAATFSARTSSASAASVSSHGTEASTVLRQGVPVRSLRLGSSGFATDSLRDAEVEPAFTVNEVVDHASKLWKLVRVGWEW
jgi:hypothetical protein